MPVQEFTLKAIFEAEDRLSKKIDAIEQKLSTLGKTTEKSGSMLSKLGGIFKDIGRQAMGMFTALVGYDIIYRLTSAVEEGITKFAELEKSMRILAVVSRESGEDIKTLASRYMQAASDAADRFGISIMETSRALDGLVRAGLSSEEAIKALNSVLEIAISEGVDAAHVADIMASTLAQFALRAEDAERVADALTNAAAVGVSTMTQYATGLSYCGAVAHQLGLNLEETLSALVMVDASIKDATKSGRYLQAMLSAMASKSKDLGFAIYDANGKMLDFGEIIKRLYKHLQTFRTEQERNAYLFRIFGEQGARAVAAIVTHLDKAVKSGKDLDRAWEDLLETISRTGTASKVAGEALDTLAGKLGRLERGAEKLKIGIGKALASPLAALGDAMYDFGDALDKLASGTAKTANIMYVGTGAFRQFLDTMSYTTPFDAMIERFEAFNRIAESMKVSTDKVSEGTEQLGRRIIDVSQKVLDAGQDWNTAFRAWSQNLYTAREMSNKFSESMKKGADSAKEQADALDIVKDKLKELEEQYRMVSEVQRITAVGMEYYSTLESIQRALVADEIAAQEERLKQLEEYLNRLKESKHATEGEIETIRQRIEATKQNIQALRESASLTIEQTLSQKRLAAIQQMLAFTSQVVSLQQTAMQLAMMGANNAADIFMNTSIALTKALEDGVITEEEMKQILEMLGVTFDETGKPVINLKDIMEEFRKKMEETRNKVQDFRSTLESLDGLTAHTYHYHHEITVHETTGGGRGATMEELGATTLHGHKTGLWEVPYTGYIARLHRGEMILPRNVAEWFRRGGITASQKIVNIHVNVNASGVSDPKELADIIERELARRWRAML